jgi:hypothetical protein
MNEVYKGKVDKLDQLIARVLDAAARMKKCADQPRRTSRGIRTRVAE